MIQTEEHATIFGLRAAIYVRNAPLSLPGAAGHLEPSLEQCRQYCTEHSYHLEEQHIYQGETEPFWSNEPHLVRLRTAALQRRFDILVVPSPETLGLLWPEPWRFLPESLAIDRFYELQVRIESVVEQDGCHDLHRQMLKAALNFVTLTAQIKARQRNTNSHNA